MVKITYEKNPKDNPPPYSSSDDAPWKQPGWEHLDPASAPINKFENGEQPYKSEFWRWSSYPAPFQSEWQVERGNEGKGFPYQNEGQPIRAGMPTGRPRGEVDPREYVPVKFRNPPLSVEDQAIEHEALRRGLPIIRWWPEGADFANGAFEFPGDMFVSYDGEASYYLLHSPVSKHGDRQYISITDSEDISQVLNKLEQSNMNNRRNPPRRPSVYPQGGSPYVDGYYPDSNFQAYPRGTSEVEVRGSPLYPSRRNPAYEAGYNDGFGAASNPPDKQMEMQGNYEEKRPGSYLPRNNPAEVWDSLSYPQKQQMAHAAGYSKVNSIAGKAWGAQSKAARAKLNPVMAYPSNSPDNGRSTQYYAPLPRDPLGDRGRYAMNESWQVTPQFSVDHQSPSGDIIGEIGFDVADPRSAAPPFSNPGGDPAKVWHGLSRAQREEALRGVGYGTRGVNLNSGKRWSGLSGSAKAKLNPGGKRRNGKSSPPPSSKATANPKKVPSKKEPRKNPSKACPKGHKGMKRLGAKYAVNPGGAKKTTWSCSPCRNAGGTGHYQ